MTPSLLFGAVFAWGIPSLAAPHDAGAYLGVIEKLAGDHVWVRAAFTRDHAGDWAPTLVREKVGAPSKLDAASANLPARITWRACRDGRSLGTIVSSRRPLQLEADLGRHALRARPAFVASAPYDQRFEIAMTGDQAARPFVISTLPDACAVGRSVRRAEADAVARVTRKVLVQRNLHTGKANRLLDARGWQAGDWSIVDLTLEEDGAWLAIVAFVTESTSVTP